VPRKIYLIALTYYIYNNFILTLYIIFIIKRKDFQSQAQIRIHTKSCNSNGAISKLLHSVNMNGSCLLRNTDFRKGNIGKYIQNLMASVGRQSLLSGKQINKYS